MDPDIDGRPVGRSPISRTGSPATTPDLHPDGDGATTHLLLGAALLHDTVEGTETTEEESAPHFGPTVVAIVVEVTDDQSLPKDRRKELRVSHAPHLSEAARLVAIADKICNVLDVGSNPPAG